MGDPWCRVSEVSQNSPRQQGRAMRRGDMRSGSVIGWVVALVILVAPAAAQTQPPPAPKRPAPSAAPTRPAAAPGPAAQTPAEPGAPSATTASYGDWVLRCSQTADTPVCEVAQTIYVQGQQAPIAVVAIGREKKSAP